VYLSEKYLAKIIIMNGAFQKRKIYSKRLMSQIFLAVDETTLVIAEGRENDWNGLGIQWLSWALQSISDWQFIIAVEKSPGRRATR
jgi:hypothetical protein